MAPDPTSPDEAARVPAHRRSGEIVHQRQLAAQTPQLFAMHAAAVAGLKGIEGPVIRTLADLMKVHPVITLASMAPSLVDTMEPIRRMMADQAKANSAMTRAAMAPALTGAMETVSRVLEIHAAAARPPIGMRVAETLGLYDSVKPFADLAKSAVFEHETALRRTVAQAARTAVIPQSSYWLSLQTQNAIRQVNADSLFTVRTALARLAEVGQLHTDLTEPLARLRTPQIPDPSARPVGHWRNYVLDLPAAPSVDQVDAALLSGQTSLGMVAADAVLSLEPGREDETVLRVDQEIIDPWQQARQQVVEELYARLRVFDSSVPGLLDGAWHEVQRQGPAWPTKAANCIVEALDRTLRKAAPNEELATWFPTSGLNRNLWPEDLKQPPHALRIRYLLRTTKDEAKMVAAMHDSLCEKLLIMNTVLRSKAQSTKHTEQGDIASVRSLLMSAEYLLQMLFLM